MNGDLLNASIRQTSFSTIKLEKLENIANLSVTVHPSSQHEIITPEQSTVVGIMCLDKF